MGKIAFVFAGQGAQYVGMGLSLYENSTIAKELFDTFDKIRPGTKEQCFYGTKEALDLTINTQPCVFAVDLCAAKALVEQGITPDCVAGFSLGETAALAFCNVMDLTTAFSFVVKRATVMNEAAEKNKGAMLAILKLTAPEIEELCKKYINVWPVNYNCETQTVVAGEPNNLNLLADDVASKGGKAIKLAVSGAFHSPFMESAANALNEYLNTVALKTPSMPLYSNYTAMPYELDINSLVTMQVKGPVKWQKTIENMAKDGVDTFIEVGPGKTLSGLIKKILPDAKIYQVENSDSLKNTISMIKQEV